jgi:hypothetical protein
MIKISVMFVMLSLLSTSVDAVSYGVSGHGSEGSAGSAGQYVLAGEDALSTSDTLSMSEGIDLTSNGAIDADHGWVDQYWEYTNGQNTLYAATYAFLQNVGEWSYSKSATVRNNFVSATERFRGAEVEGMRLGGFAYNTVRGDYAAVQTAGDAKSISYSNILRAALDEAYGWQSVRTGKSTLAIYNWGEKGNYLKEARDEAAVKNGNLGPADSDYFDQFAGEYASFETEEGLKSYTGSGSSSIKWASSKQSGHLADAANAYFSGGAVTGMPGGWMIGDLKTKLTNTLAYCSDAFGIAYDGGSKASRSKVTSDQQFSVLQTGYAYKLASAWSYKSGADATDEVRQFKSDTETVKASMSGSNSAIVKDGYLSVDQTLNAAGGSIYRAIGASTDYFAVYDQPAHTFAQTYIFNKGGDWLNRYPDWQSIDYKPSGISTLRGKAKAEVINGKVSSQTGSWSANIAKDLTEYPDGYRGPRSLHSIAVAVKWPGTLWIQPAVSFDEAIRGVYSSKGSTRVQIKESVYSSSVTQKATA